MARRSETLQIKLDVDGEGNVRASLAGVDQNIEKVDESQQRATNSAKLLRAALTALPVATLAALSSRALDTAASLGDAADAADISIAALQELRFAVQRSGGDISQLDAGVRRFTRRLGQAADGSGPAVNALESLNIQFRDADGNMRNTESVLDDVINKLAGMENQARRSALASQLFGNELGPELSLFLAQGTEGVEALRSKAHELEFVLEEDLVRGAAAASDQIDNLKQKITTEFTRAVLENSEAIEGAAESLGEFVDWLLEVDKNTLIVVASLASARFIGPMFGRISVQAAGMAGQFINATRESHRLQMALARMNGTSTATASSLLALGTAGRAVRGVMSLLGGPAGIIIGAATALSTWSLTTSDASEDTQDLSDRVDALLGKYDDLRQKRVKETMEEITEAMREQEEAIAEITREAKASAPNSPLGGEQQAQIDERVAKLKELGGQYSELAAKLRELRAAEAGGVAANDERGESASLPTGDKETDKYIQNLRRRYQALDESLLNEQDRILLAEEEKRFLVEELYQENLIGFKERQRLLLEIEAETAEKRLAIEERISDQIMQMRFNVFNQAAGLLRQFAGESQEAAIAVIAIEKGLAIARTIMNTNAAIMRAYAELGPIAGSAAAAKIKLLGNVSVGLIAASGLAQAANVGGGGADAGSPANPINTTSPAQTSSNIQAANDQGPRGTTYINVEGTPDDEALDKLFERIEEAADRQDKILFSRNSRQAREIRRG